MYSVIKIYLSINSYVKKKKTHLLVKVIERENIFIGYGNVCEKTN